MPVGALSLALRQNIGVVLERDLPGQFFLMMTHFLQFGSGKKSADVYTTCKLRNRPVPF